MAPPTVYVETVKKLTLQPGDILHVQVGGDIEVGDQTVTWVPTRDELEEVGRMWVSCLPPGVSAMVTHHLVDEQIIQSQIRVGTWPPKVKSNGP